VHHQRDDQQDDRQRDLDKPNKCIRHDLVPSGRCAIGRWPMRLPTPDDAICSSPWPVPPRTPEVQMRGP
jgi:hypothetical protein